MGLTPSLRQLTRLWFNGITMAGNSKMRQGIIAIGLSAILGLAIRAHAQEPPRPERANIVYLYRMEPTLVEVEGKNNVLQSLLQSMAAQHPRSRIMLFDDVTDPEDYVALITDPHADPIKAAGWSKDFLDLYSSDFPAGRSFLLDSTLLVGKPDLNATSSSYVQIEHVDSDPLKREAAKPLFEQLDREIRKQPGFKDLQVWTWTARTNHWTVIQVWENEAASRKAARQPVLIKILDQLYGNAAAPSSLNVYRLIKSIQQ